MKKSYWKNYNSIRRRLDKLKKNLYDVKVILNVLIVIWWMGVMVVVVGIRVGQGEISMWLLASFILIILRKWKNRLRNLGNLGKTSLLIYVRLINKNRENLVSILVYSILSKIKLKSWAYEYGMLNRRSKIPTMKFRSLDKYKDKWVQPNNTFNKREDKYWDHLLQMSQLSPK